MGSSGQCSAALTGLGSGASGVSVCHHHPNQKSVQLTATGHTSHAELVAFLKRSKAALRDDTSLIVVKENTCEDNADGSPREFLDEEDSSLTRYVFLAATAAWRP